MTRITTCPACEMGDHKHHYRVVQSVPEGMMGGAICDCKGECKDGRYKRHDPALEALASALASERFSGTIKDAELSNPSEGPRHFIVGVVLGTLLGLSIALSFGWTP